MSTMRDDFKTDIQDAFFTDGDMAETITYTHKGEALTLSAVAEIGEQGSSTRDAKAKGEGYDAVFTIKYGDIPGGPVSGDKITYAGKSYTFVAPDQVVDGILYRLQFVAKETALKFG